MQLDTSKARENRLSAKQLQVALIGAGRIGKVHGETLAFRIPQVKLLSIADQDRAAAESLAAHCGIPNVFDTSEAIFTDPRIDAVLICSPTDTHADLVIRAAACGKHIFCEKPIDLGLAKIDAALAAVEQAGVKFQVGFNRRFDPSFARVR